MARYIHNKTTHQLEMVAGYGVPSQDRELIESIIAPIENSATVSKNYAIGQQFIRNETLYKAKTALTSGTTWSSLTLNTDYEESDPVVEQIGDFDVSGKADKVSNATNGNFAGLDANGNLTDSGLKASDFLSSSYLESSTKTTADSKDTFTFTNAAITANASFDVYSDVFGAPIVDMVLSGNQLSISFNSSDNVSTCRLYIK